MTAAQRKAAAALMLPFLVVGVTPDATPTVEWRAASAWGYSLVAAPTEEAGGIIHLRGSVNAVSNLTGSVNSTMSLQGSVDAVIQLRGRV